MRLALVAFAFALPAASSAEAPVPPKPGKIAVPARICPRDMQVREAGTPVAPQLRRLGELPPGSLTLTVVNQVGECIEPVVVRQGYGTLGDGNGR
jgi:hypothetical protein